MFLRMEQLSGVDNPRHYRTEIVEELQELLLSGSSALPDPKRKSCYNLENHERLFFIHISPNRGTAALIATWLLRSQGTVEPADCAEANMQTTA
jgi:hypothetical protein